MRNPVGAVGRLLSPACSFPNAPRSAWPAPRRVVRADRESSGRRLARESALAEKSRFGVEQIVGILKEADAGVRVGSCAGSTGSATS